jgi:hypothetical protein
LSEKIEPHARLVASLAETMSDRMWAADIIERCRMIRQAVEEIERVARGRLGGER